MREYKGLPPLARSALNSKSKTNKANKANMFWICWICWICWITCSVATMVQAQQPCAIPSCPPPALSINIPTQSMTSPADPSWTDSLGYASDGLIMTQSVAAGSSQLFLFTKLYDTTNPYAFARVADMQTSYRQGVVASATRLSDNSKRVHVHWGGYMFVNSQIVYSNMVNLLRALTPTNYLVGTSVDTRAVTMASGRQIQLGVAASCGFASPEISIFAFGRDMTTPSTMRPRTSFDGYNIITDLLFTYNMSAIPGGLQQTPRTAPAGVSAGTLCIFAGGVALNSDGNDGQHLTEVSMLDMSAGLSGMRWIRGAPLRVARRWVTGISVDAQTFTGQSPVHGQKVVFGGGILPDNTASDAVEIYDVTTNTTECSCLPSGGRWGIAMTVIMDQYVVFAGGYSGNAATSAQSVTSALDLYDVVNKRWILLPNTLSVARGFMSIGTLKHPGWSSTIGGFKVIMSGGTAPNTQIMTIDLLTTLIIPDFSANGLPEPRYKAGYSSWPTTSTAIPNTLNGQILLAGGITTNGAVLGDYLTLKPALSPTISSNWIRTQFADNPGSRFRQGMMAYILPVGGTGGTVNTKDAVFWGGRTELNDRSYRVDMCRLDPAVDSVSNWITSPDESSFATCFTGTAKNPLAVIATQALGYQGSYTDFNYVRWTERSSSLTSYDIKGWDPQVANPRWSGVGVGAGRFCLFAGGQNVSTYTDTVNVFDAATANADSSPVSPYGYPITTNIPLKLTQPRTQLAAAFIPRPNTGGMTGYNGYVLFAGGQLVNGQLSDRVDILDTSKPFASWTFDGTQRLSVARRGATAVGAGSRYIFIAGGMTAATTASNVVEMFDAVTYTVTPIRPLNVARQSIAGGVKVVDIDNGVYEVSFIGGADGNGVPLAAVDNYWIPNAGPVW